MAISNINTLEDFETLINLPGNEDLIFEFIDGEIIEVPSNAYSSEIGVNVIFLLKLHDRETRLGHITGENAGYMIAGARLSPDVAYISKARQPEFPREGYCPNPPELAVEVISPTDRESALTKKLAKYREAGVVVWVFRPKTQTAEVHVPGKPTVTYGINDTLDGGDVLPGFQLSVREVFQT